MVAQPGQRFLDLVLNGGRGGLDGGLIRPGVRSRGNQNLMRALEPELLGAWRKENLAG